MVGRRGFLAGAAALAAAAPLWAQADREDRALEIAELLADPARPSTLALRLAGGRVEVLGYMAPPHGRDVRHFALVAAPTPVSPFNAPDTTWPAHVLPVFTVAALRVIPFNLAIRATGRLEAGSFENEEFGFPSRLRLVDASYDRA